MHGTRLLGTQDGGSYYWRHDEAFFCRADFQRIFRSISLHAKTSAGHARPDQTSTSILNDAMDVIAMTLPLSIKLAPSPDLLGLAAQKLLGGYTAPQTTYSVARKDLSTLLRLLLRLRLQKATWRRGFTVVALTNLRLTIENWLICWSTEYEPARIRTP